MMKTIDEKYTRAAEIREELKQLSDPATAAVLCRFFKTGPGEYGEGDIFRGIRVPVLRGLAKRCDGIRLPGIEMLLKSPYHEDRLLALFILVRLFVKGDNAAKEAVYNFYLENTGYINNWDLVDASAAHIVGAYLWDRKRDPLYVLARSEALFERRIAVLATFYFIQRGEFGETLVIAERLMADREDLIHKALGWMLREIGKRDMEMETSFLQQHYKRMPRVMLRYAIEKFPEDERQRYLKGDI